jgi:hypothetical protein
MELSKFTNGDKKAIVERKDHTYNVNFYVKGRIVSKEAVSDFSKAENLAENFVNSESANGPGLLNENV